MEDQCNVDFHTFCNKRMEDLEKLILARFVAIDKTTELLSASLEKRLDAMNEIKGAMKDAQAYFITRGDLDAAQAQMKAELQILLKSKAFLEGRASQNSVYLTLALTLAALIMSGLSLFHSLKG